MALYGLDRGLGVGAEVAIDGDVLAGGR